MLLGQEERNGSFSVTPLERQRRTATGWPVVGSSRDDPTHGTQPAAAGGRVGRHAMREEMSVVTDEEEFQELARLIADTLQLSQTLGGRSYTARPGYEITLQFVAGWFRHIEYIFNAVDLLLLGSDCDHAVPPLLRLMLEDAVSAALVATDPQSWAAVLVTQRRSESKTLKAMQAVGMEPSPEMLGLIDSFPEDEGDGYREYRQIRSGSGLSVMTESDCWSLGTCSRPRATATSQRQRCSSPTTANRTASLR